MKPTSTRGKRDALAHPTLVDDAALAELKKDSVEEIQKAAQEHDREALETILDIMQNRKTSPSVRRACARDIIEIGLDRKIGAPNPATQQQNSGGLTINILNLTDGSETVSRDFRNTKDIAGEIQAGAAKALAELDRAQPQEVEVTPISSLPSETEASGTATPDASTPDWKP